MTSYLLDREGTPQTRVDRERIEAHLAAGAFFWLDLHRPGEEDYEVLREIFHFHPLAVEDSVQFGQRPKLEEYDDFAFLVLYGAGAPSDEDLLVEIHCFHSERYLVTVRHDETPACDAVRARYVRRQQRPTRAIVLVYQLLDALVDSFFPVLSDLDDRLDELEGEMLTSPGQEHLQEVLALRRRLVELRRVVSPQRDLVGQLASGAVELPGLDAETERYFRDVHDHLIHLSEQVDMYRDLLTGTTDVYLSNASNRLNAVMKQLAIIATIFLPLTFISGFFGQNFRWMVDRVDGWPQFILLGVVLELAAVAALVMYFRRRGWF